MLNRVSLNTIGLNRIGLNRIGKPSRGSFERPYIDPEVLASLKAVCICYGKSNDDPDRAIVKNLVDPDNPFVISNAAFKLNSGFGKYEDDFTNWVAETGTKLTSDKITNSNPTKNWIAYRSSGVEFKEMHIRILGIPDNGVLYFQRPPTDGGPIRMFNGDNNIPAFTSTGICGFFINNLTGLGWSNLVIEQIPSFEGAFVTDGIDDTIISTKTLAEMGITDEVTVVSMVHQISLNSTYNFSLTNYIENLDGSGRVRNEVFAADKTGIYGYSASLVNKTTSIINTILGDKNDYIAGASSTSVILEAAKFSVVGRASNISEVSSIAWYWNFISNKYLTTDQINQVIAYFNLDRTLKPDILCNTIKQGITNENHAEFGDKLIDFSGNGRDIQLNNIAWKGDSGIGKYEVDFLDSSIWNSSNSTITSSKIDCKNAISHIMLLYYSVGSKEYPDIPSFKVIKTGADIDYSYIDETGSPKSVRIVDGVNVLPASHNTLYSGSGRFCGFGNPGMGNSVTVTQIPSHAGGLCLDGVNDFGQFVGDLGLKDYTLVVDRAYTSLQTRQVPLVSSINNTSDTPFVFEYYSGNGGAVCFTYGKDNNTGRNININREISYQSTYCYNKSQLTKGTSVSTGDGLTIGRYGSDVQYASICLYYLLLFPYSMSEFLIERQLKKHKLGTLYPDMVEFRPIINGKTDLIKEIKWFSNSWSKRIYPGDYITKGVDVTATILLNYNGLKLTKASYGNEYTEVRKQANWSETNNIWDLIIHNIGKSPQKIDITIEQDENYVQWNPVVESNAEYSDIAYLNYSHNIATINVGDYINVGDTVGIRVILNSTIDEVVNCKVNGQECEIVNVSPRVFDCKFTLTSESPQKINITIYQPPEYLTMLSNSTLISNETLIKNE